MSNWIKLIAEVPEKVKCGIHFENNPSKVYYSGQSIRGNVNLRLSETKKVRSAFVKFIGKAHVQWSEGYGDSQTVYKNKEIFLDERIYVLGEKGGTFEYKPGSHAFSFEYHLAERLPTSFEAKCGCIRYKACFVLDIPMWPDDEFEESFTVIKVSTLSPKLREPVASTKETKFYTFCFIPFSTSEPLTIIAQTSAGGYIPREIINLHLHVINRSNQEVLEILVQLIQEFKYISTTKKKTDKIVLKQEYTKGCEPNHEEDFHINIVVPTVPSNQEAISKIVKIQYYIRVTVEVPCCHNDLELTLPIIVGSSPVEEMPPIPPWINQLYMIDSFESRDNKRRSDARNPFLM